ncbi:MAG: DinB family protein [Gemmatimonadaceae bacterium]|nr:DinB family protein [Gemmatimonadaceae bacterium]
MVPVRLVLSAALLVSATPALAQNIKAETIAAIDDAATKLVALAEAMPADKYSWRPAPGVRSVSEVFIHVAGGNLGIPGIAGVKRRPDAPLARDAEKTVTDKAAVIAALKASFTFVKAAVNDVPDAELDASVNLFGQKSTKRGVLLLLATHNHEHLGQTIAYARMNGVKPPWSGGN